jgi:hypothetical protein
MISMGDANLVACPNVCFLRMTPIDTGLGSLGPGIRNFLVSSWKYFKNRCRGDLSRSRFVNAKQKQKKSVPY